MDLGQDTLFGKKIISSINFNEQEIIKDILYLHGDGNYIDCDPTFSTGNFYNEKMRRPKYIFDKFPQVAGVIEATSDKLPLDNESCKVIMFDPPFIMGMSESDKKNKFGGITGTRFTAFKNFDELKEMYSGSLKEFERILMPNGIVIFKCQDVVSSQKNHFTHCWLMNEALRLGFYPKDLFILFAKNRINDGRKQQHARKYHSYFWVFQKKQNKIIYEEQRTSRTRE